MKKFMIFKMGTIVDGQLVHHTALVPWSSKQYDTPEQADYTVQAAYSISGHEPPAGIYVILPVIVMN